ncbi:MAG: TFIIB-type zinc finger domain-containing protein [Oscillospiraceae bacterium]|nr:TFIIB-type zinc finger domain-containing protein [Oscillospiraceae bacterium]
MLVLLPPVGAVFMWQKLSYEKMQAYRNGQVLAFLGGVVAVLAARLPLAELRLHLHEKIGAADLKLMLIFGGVSLAGIVIMLLGIKISRAGELDLYLLYLIQERKITDLPMLADMAGISYKTLTLKLEKLIDGPLQNAYIYHRDKALILPGISERSAFRCGQCGATTVLYANEERICDYCGAPL